MTWRDQLRPASFRGVTFHVLSDQATFGRRVVLHEYPFRDEPATEDLGRKAREIRINAIIIGDDYMDRRDALIQAAEEAGSGKLVHPQFGEMDVSIMDSGLSIDHSTSEGGCCRISFSCIESGEFKFPSSQAVTEEVVRSRADAAGFGCLDAFTKGFTFDGLPGWAQAEAIGKAQLFLDRMQSSVSSIAGIGARTGLLSIVSALSPQLAHLLSDGMGFAQEVRGLFSRFRGASSADVAVRTFAAFADFGAGETHIASVTPMRRQVAINNTALVELVRAVAVVERAAALADMEFPSYTDAIVLRDSVVDQIDRVADITADDTLYTTLAALRAAVVRDVSARGADLSDVVSVTPPRTLPALVLAYQLYEDPSRDSEIVERNRIPHPGNVAGGQALEVLSE